MKHLVPFENLNEKVKISKEEKAFLTKIDDLRKQLAKVEKEYKAWLRKEMTKPENLEKNKGFASPSVSKLTPTK
jgi:hypothetical protein